MKKFAIYGIILSVVITFTSCFGLGGGDDDNTDFNYESGNIPGFGSTEGDLTGTVFNLPAGVSLIGDIAASGNSDGYWDLSETKSYKFTNKDDSETERYIYPKTMRNDSVSINYRGSGSGLVELLIPLHNSNNSSVTVTFPAALVVQNIAGECQNGVLLKETSIVIPANSDYYLNLSFYCANLSKTTPGASDLYNFAVVSNADPILELCEMLKNKKINIEEFDPNSSEDQSTFQGNAATLQLVVWTVTDSSGLTQLYEWFIERLPNSN